MSEVMDIKERVCQFLSFNMLICAKIGASVQNLCPVRHFNPKLLVIEVGQRVSLLSRPKNFDKIQLYKRYQNI